MMIRTGIVAMGSALLVGAVGTAMAGDGPTAPAPTDWPRLETPVPPPDHLLQRPVPTPEQIAEWRERGRRARALGPGEGLFRVIQVNVDDLGRNITGDAGNEPSIAVDPTNPDRMAIGWRHFRTVENNFREAGNAFTTDGGRTWTFPGVLTPGVFRSDPVLDTTSDGTFFYNSLSSMEVVDFFMSEDTGRTWRGPTPAPGGDKEWFTIDKTDGIGGGNIYAAWSPAAGCCDERTFIRSIDGGRTFSTPMAVPGFPLWGTLSVGPEGTLYIAGVPIPQLGGAPVARSSNARDPNQSPVFEFARVVDIGGSVIFQGFPNPAGLLGQMWVATDHSDGPTRGNVYLLSTVRPSSGGDPADVMFVRSRDRGQTWSDPIRINDDPPNPRNWQWFGAISVAPGGRIDVTWFDTRNAAPHLSELYYAYSTDGGDTWSRNLAISPEFDSRIGWPRQNKIGDYTDMDSDAAGARLAFAATFNGEQDVYYMHIVLDCNDNGIHDGEDIASGASRDDDGNGVPDECEAVIECGAIRRFSSVCRRGRIKAKIKSSLPEGTRVTLDNNGDRLAVDVNARGKGKAKWTQQRGLHTVFMVECPGRFKPVNCGP